MYKTFYSIYLYNIYYNGTRISIDRGGGHTGGGGGSGNMRVKNSHRMRLTNNRAIIFLIFMDRHRLAWILY